MRVSVGRSLLSAALATRPAWQIVRMTGSAPAVSINAGALVNIDWSVSLARTGERLAEHAPHKAPFDEGNVRLVVGGGGYLPVLHEVITQLDVIGEEKTFEIAPYDAFGERSADLGPVDFPISAAPEGLGIGMTVQLSNGLKAKVTKMTDATVTIDANPELAGEALSITVKLLEEPIADAYSVLSRATFAAGCFWGIELAYQREPGVIATKVGYTQGTSQAPTYEKVCTGTTGHTEAVQVTYDPNEVSYERLCEIFWDRLGESRYKLNQVGNDRGTQYRHGIYPHDAEQSKIALATLKAARAAAPPGKQVHTEVFPATEFWRAETYHQQYLQKGGQSAKKHAEETIRCYG